MPNKTHVGLFLLRDEESEIIRMAALGCGLTPVLLDEEAYQAAVYQENDSQRNGELGTDNENTSSLRYIITDREAHASSGATGAVATSTDGTRPQVLRVRDASPASDSNELIETLYRPLDPESAFKQLWRMVQPDHVSEDRAVNRIEAEEQAAQDAESLRVQLRAVLDTIQESVMIIDREQNVVLSNKAANELFERPESLESEEMFASLFEVSLPDGELLLRPDWPSVRALAGEFVRDFEVFIRRRDTGRLVITEINTSPIRGKNGEIDRVVISYRDVTESRKMSQAQSQLAAIVESSQDAIIGKDRTGIVTSWNRGAEKLFGYAASEIIGHSIRRLLPPGQEQQEDEILARIGRGETVEHIETERRRKDGEIIEVSLTISPIRDASGRVCGASKIARDVTDRRRLERQLQQSQKMEAVGQLTGGIAHDFNNLLGVIVGNLDLLERQVAGNEEALKRLKIAQRGAARGTDLTRRLLAFSSKENLRPTVTSLNDSIQSILDMAARALGPEIKITMNLDPLIPPVFVDGAGLESALLNLSVNARDAMPRGGSLTISTQLRSLEESYPPVHSGELSAGVYACVSISDTGEGMSKEVLQRAFEPFFTTKARHKGTGLGLAMVYGFVKQSGGTVRIYSELGYGTTVSCYLPLAATQFLAPDAHMAALSMNRGNVVLIVDDEEDLLEVAATFLQEMNYEVHRSSDAAGAVALFEQLQRVDLLITDIIMPGGMNGVELALQLRRVNPALNVIYCSGFPADALAERSMPLVDGLLLRKPYQHEEFTSIVRQIMGTDPAQSEVRADP